jgi:hypothetical protein
MKPTPKGYEMQLYTIRRRSGWATAAELEKAAARSREVADNEFPDDIRWIRSYVLPEDDGTLGTLCVYQASSDEAIRSHATRVGMPADEINAVADTVIIRPDPEPAPAAA